MERGAAGGEAQVPLATPPGFTLVSVTTIQRPNEAIQAEARSAIRFGLPDGSRIYVRDEGAEPCEAACIEQFPPVVAPADVREDGPWTLLDRSDGARQWAYRGKGLHIAKGWAMPRLSEGLTAPEGWQIAEFTPAADLPLPADVEIREIAAASGVSLVDRNGMTLYYRHGAAGRSVSESDCRGIPLIAPLLASNVGAFSIVVGDDGSRQWAYNGQPLFTSARDQLPDDIKALDCDGPKWTIAYIYKYFMPASVRARTVAILGTVWSTENGLPLYTRHRYDQTDFGGRNYRGGFRQPYVLGRTIGIAGCDADCLQERHPFEAPADAHASHYWEVIERPDGKRQWAYRGAALYTYALDKPNAEAMGNNVFTPDEGDFGPYKISQGPTTALHPMFRTGAWYWHVAIPTL